MFMGRKLWLRLGLLFFGSVVGLVGFELVLRVFFPNSLFAAATKMQFAAGMQKNYQPDPECGYLPVVGNGFYDLYGCDPNHYDPKDRKGRKRILFVGDSVTRRGRMVRALQKLYGDSAYEYWNAGVESFNVAQELVFYRRHNAALQPDEVVLTFHNNDFQETPLVFRKDGELQIYSTRKDRSHINPWLLEHCYVYRWLMGLSLGRLDQERQSQAVGQQLRDWQKELDQQHIAFRVVLFPILKPLDQWSAREKWSRETSLRLLRESGIAHFDLMPTLERCLQARVPVQENPEDSWHPSDAAAAEFALDLKKQALFTVELPPHKE